MDLSSEGQNAAGNRQTSTLPLVDVPDGEKIPHLISAVVQGHSKFVKFLLSMGTDVNSFDDEGVTLLMHSARCGQEGLARHLIGLGADLNRTDNTGKTALIHAVEGKTRTQFVVYLVTRGARVNIADDTGKTPLMFALERKRKQVVEYLVERGAKVNVSDTEGNTPLILAVKTRKSELVALLVSCGAKENKQNNKGESPLLVAVDLLRLTRQGPRMSDRRPTCECEQLLRPMNHCHSPILPPDQDVFHIGQRQVKKRHITGSDVEFMSAAVPIKRPRLQEVQPAPRKTSQLERTVDILMTAGADVFQASNTGITPLTSAWRDLFSGRGRSTVRLLMNPGDATTRAPSTEELLDFCWKKDVDRMTTGRAVSALLFAVLLDQDDLERKCSGWCRNAINMSRKLKGWKAPLHVVGNLFELLNRRGLFTGQLEVLSSYHARLRDKGAVRCGRTAMSSAIRFGQRENAQVLFLLGVRASPSSMTWWSWWSSSFYCPLHEAVTQNAADVAKALLSAGARAGPYMRNVARSGMHPETRVVLHAAGVPMSVVELWLKDQVDDRGLKNQCRNAIRQHLLWLDPAPDLYVRIPKLNLPALLKNYLLYQPPGV